MSHARKPVIKRRTVAAGAAWTVPVIAVAAAAPGFAASSEGPVITSPSAVGRCKQPGEPKGENCQGYRISINFSVPPTDPWTVTFTQVMFNGNDETLTTSPRVFTVSSDAPQINFTVCTFDDSETGVVMTLSWTATNTRTGVTTTGSVNYDLGNLRPCDDK